MEGYEYPTARQLKAFRKWHIGSWKLDVSVDVSVKELIDYIESLWWMSDWGFKLYKSRSHILGVQALQIHNRFYDFNPTMQRLLEEIAKEQAPFILDIGYSSDDSGMTLTVYYT